MSVHAFKLPVSTHAPRQIVGARTIEKSLGDMLQILAATSPGHVADVETYVIELLDHFGPQDWWTNSPSSCGA